MRLGRQESGKGEIMREGEGKGQRNARGEVKTANRKEKQKRTEEGEKED